MPPTAVVSGSLRSARAYAETALKQQVAEEKARYSQHKKLRDSLTSRISTVASLFELLDKDHNGLISREEFREAMGTLGGDFEMPVHIYDELFDEFDADHSGEISYKEYIQYVLRDSIRRKATLFRDFFIRSDTSGDGTIDKAEFRKAVMLLHGEQGHQMEIAAHMNEIDEVFDDMDADGSGTLTLHELHRHLRCGVGMGKFTRPRDPDGQVVQRTKPRAKLRGSLLDQFLFHNKNKAFFDHSLDHHAKYVERKAVAEAAYGLASDERFDAYLDSGSRVQLARGLRNHVPILHLHSNGYDFAPPTPRRLPSVLESAAQTAPQPTSQSEAQLAEAGRTGQRSSAAERAHKLGSTAQSTCGSDNGWASGSTNGSTTPLSARPPPSPRASSLVTPPRSPRVPPSALTMAVAPPPPPSPSPQGHQARRLGTSVWSSPRTPAAARTGTSGVPPSGGSENGWAAARPSVKGTFPSASYEGGSRPSLPAPLPPPMVEHAPALSAGLIEPHSPRTPRLQALWKGNGPWRAPTSARAALNSTVVGGASTLALRSSTLARVDAPADFVVGDNVAERRRRAIPEKIEVAKVATWLQRGDPAKPNCYSNRSLVTPHCPRWDTPHVAINPAGEPEWVRVPK